MKFFNSINLRWYELVVFFMLLVSYPYVFRQIVSLPNLSIIYGVVLVLMFIIVLSKGIPKAAPKRLYVCVGIQIFCFFLFYVYHSDSFYFIRIFYILLTISVLSVFKNADELLDFNRKNNFLLAFQAFLGGLAFFLIFFGLIQPIMQVENTDSRLSNLYLLTNARGAFLSNIKRICGYFDEPGSLAFWGIYSLLINKLFINNKYVEYVLIIGMLFTLSMAYYIQLAMYMLFFYSSGMKRGQGSRWSQVLIVVIIILLGAWVFSDSQSELFELTFGRFGLAGNDIDNNRAFLMEECRKYFLMSPIFGVGPTTLYSKDYLMDNPFETLATDGIIGTFVIYLPLLYILFHGRREDRYALLIIVAGYLQRPLHNQFIHYLMLYIFLYLVLVASTSSSKKFYLERRK